MFRIRKEVDNYIYEECESTCHECTSKYEVKNFKEGIAVEKEESTIKKDMENKETVQKT